MKVLDFGIAKVLADPLMGAVGPGSIDTYGLLGTPLYMSPEQVESSKHVDPSTDVWSLGSALYCALAGRAPHADVKFHDLFHDIRKVPAPPLCDRAPWVAAEVAELVHRALEIDRKRRTPSATAMRPRSPRPSAASRGGQTRARPPRASRPRNARALTPPGP